MKLKCMGDGECPEWLLSGLHAIGQLTAPRAKSLCMLVAEHLAGEPLQEQKIISLLADVKLDAPDDVKMVTACIMFALTSTAKWGADGAELDSGLRSVGVAWEISRALRAAYDQHGSDIVTAMRKKTLTLSRLNSASTEPAPGDAIDCIQLNLNIQDVINKHSTQHNILLQKRDIPELINELKKARKYMD